MRAMGLISYTFYLVHLPCLTLLELYTQLDKPVRALAGFAASILVSAAMYFLVERHLGALRRRLHEQGRHDAARGRDHGASRGHRPAAGAHASNAPAGGRTG
jgi:peptidoglycan/LPS O-acetylase OafA/YrhL